MKKILITTIEHDFILYPNSKRIRFELPATPSHDSIVIEIEKCDNSDEIVTNVYAVLK